jgi:hypothetical protein
MNPPAEVARGVRALRHLLQAHTMDLRHLDLVGFRIWLQRQIAHWQKDAVFLQRSRIRDLRRAHPALGDLETAHHRAALADAASPAFPRLRQLEHELHGATLAVAGLTAALPRSPAAKRAALREKLRTFRERRRALRRERAALVGASPERRRLVRLARKLQRLRAAIGLEREEAVLAQLLLRQGRRSHQSGHSFEQVALALTRDRIVPELVRDGEEHRRLRVLQRVRLGAACVEFDQLVIRLSRRGDGPVDVLAAVEVKRNPNDLAHGFCHRQEDLAWLTNEVGRYDPARYRTGYYRSGHFDRPAAHDEGGETFRFDAGSFHRFRPDLANGQRLDRVYLITRPGILWGVSAAVLARIGHRIATDEGWQPDADASLRDLLRWCQDLAETIETPDVLRFYVSTPRCARQVLLCACGGFDSPGQPRRGASQ